MQTLDLQKMSLSGLDSFEATQVNGGWSISDVYTYLTGRSLPQDLRSLTREAMSAYGQVIAECGTTASQMPFK